MIRNNSFLKNICGGASSSSKTINSENALLMELHSNPVLVNTMFTLMNNAEIQKLLSDPVALKEFGSLVNRLDPKFVETLPRLFEKYKTIYGEGFC